MKNNNNVNKIIITIVAVALMGIIFSGSTFAYLTWTSSTEQQTQVNVTVQGATLTITGPNATKTGLYPTNDCNSDGVLISDEITATVENETGSAFYAYLSITPTFTPVAGRTALSADAQGNINWAIVDVTDGNTLDCGSVADENKGTFGTKTGTYVNPSNSSDTENYFDTGMTFKAPAEATTSRKYKVYVWIDETYTFNNSGDYSTGESSLDPMQDITISVKFSRGSYISQEENRIYYFNLGDTMDSVTGGWTESGYSSGSYTVVYDGTIDDFLTATTNARNMVSIIGTINPIDLTNIKTLYANLPENAIGPAAVVVSSDKDVQTNEAQFYSTGIDSGILSIDVSSLTGNYYIAIRATGSLYYPNASIKVDKIWGIPK